ncbi:MAG: hypothetical protein KatS3mg131_1857 [Candidatus Tectimicrobiota bacterium]|nr:MAG: hypothetical protein KatS3mg131_1857 [Candidatus Tectomicrobia bacterium]
MATALPFDAEHVLEEWRRLYDWAVLSRQRLQVVEEIGLLGQQFSGLWNAYRHTTHAGKRRRLEAELRAALAAMRAYYAQLPAAARPAVHLPPVDGD